MPPPPVANQFYHDTHDGFLVLSVELSHLLPHTFPPPQVANQFYHDTHDGFLVLSVDDDPINQMVVENLLSTEGYQV